MLLMRKILFLAFRKGVVYAFPSWDLYHQEHNEVYVDSVRFLDNQNLKGYPHALKDGKW